MIISTDARGNLVARLDGHDGACHVVLHNGTEIFWEERDGTLTSEIVAPRQVQFLFPPDLGFRVPELKGGAG